jgi:hypothetical protein
MHMHLQEVRLTETDSDAVWRWGNGGLSSEYSTCHVHAHAYVSTDSA